MIMWLSEAIEKDAETKGALRDLEKLIRKYEDATKLPEKSKFLSTEMRLFRPRVLSYAILVFGFGLVGYFSVLPINVSQVQGWLQILLRISVPIFVLAVTITNLARSFSESVKFAGKYFSEVCRIELYTCFTLLTILITLLTWGISDTKSFSVRMIWFLTGACLGATLSCITGIAFIIRETIRCGESSRAVEAATNYASRKLSHALVKQYYLVVWMSKYSTLIEEWSKEFKAISSPSQYYSISRSGNDNQKEVSLEFNIDIHEGAVDYNFTALKKMDRFLKPKDVKLFLLPHSYQKNKAVLGTIQYDQVPNIDRVFAKTNKIAMKGCRFYKDKFQEESERFWREHFNKLENALRKAICENEISQMYQYLASISHVIKAVEKARKDPIVRKANDHLGSCWDLIDLYRKSLRRILLEGQQRLEHEDKAYSFTELLTDSLYDQVKEILKNGDWATLKLINWSVLRMYSEYEKCSIDKSSELWRGRARFGSFYVWINGLFEQYCVKVKEENKVRMRIVLHEGVTKWIIMGLEKKDIDLVNSLCSAAKGIAFERKQMCFQHKELACQHLILLGKMISKHLNEEVIYDDVKNLVSEPFGNTLKVDFEELLSFYLENQVPIEGQREYLRLFATSTRQGRSDPLTRSGPSSSYRMGLGGYEMALSFVYLGSFALNSGETPEVRPIEFISGHFRQAIEKIKKLTDGDFWDYRRGLGTIEKWVDDCSEKHTQQKAERIAGTQINEETWQNYDKGFQEGLLESIPFVDYCIKRGYVKESDTAIAERKLYVPKERFLGRSADEIIRQGRSYAHDIGSHANSWVIRSLIDFIDEKADEDEDGGMKLIEDDETRKRAAKDVQKAVAWLKNAGCDKEQGVVVLKGVGPDVLHLYEDSEYTESGAERGVEGYYHEYPVLYLWDDRGHPLCAAIDFRGWSGLSVRSELMNGIQAGKVLGIRDRTPDELEKAIGEGREEVRAKGDCVVEMELFWKGPEEKPKQKVFPYELPPPELTGKADILKK